MLGDFLKLLRGDIQTAAGLSIHPIPGDPRHLLVHSPGEGTSERAIPAKLRDHFCANLETLIEFAISGRCPKPAIWYGPGAVTLCPNDDDRRDLVTLVLPHTVPFRKLHYLDSERPALPQAAFIKLLRFDLGAPAEIVNRYRRLEWRAKDNATSRQDVRGQSLGREIDAICHGVDQLPDAFTLAVPVYDVPGEREAFDVEVLFEVDTATQSLYLVPAPSTLRIAEERAVESIGRRLRETLGKKEVPVYCGNAGN